MNNISNTTIQKLGLRLSEKHIDAQTPTGSRIFDYPHLENVFVMESDLYGNEMPDDSCFLAFYGKHGLIGKHMTVEMMNNSSIADIQEIVDTNTDG